MAGKIWSRACVPAFLALVFSTGARSAFPQGKGGIPSVGRREEARSKIEPRAVSKEEAAETILETLTLAARFTPRVQGYIEQVACQFNLEGRAGIQEGLLREDLVWKNFGLSARQIDIVVAVALGKAAGNAVVEYEKTAREIDHAPAGSNLLSRGSERKGVALEEREKAERKLGSLERFILEAAGIARKILGELGKIEDSELRFTL
jgi:hypothetical protein